MNLAGQSVTLEAAGQVDVGQQHADVHPRTQDLSASSALTAAKTRNPASTRTSATSIRTSGSSSTTRTAVGSSDIAYPAPRIGLRNSTFQDWLCCLE